MEIFVGEARERQRKQQDWDYMKFEMYKDWEGCRKAQKEFQEFLKTLPGKGFTVMQMRMIGAMAQEETERVTNIIERKIALTPELFEDVK